MSDEITKLTTHIRDRLAKSTLDSPSIHISRDGWDLIIRALEASAQKWQPIDTAPKDGTKFDAWAVHPQSGTTGVRFTDVQMRGDGSGFGIIINRAIGVDWVYLERDSTTYPEWKLTHWQPLPAPPQE